MSGTRLSVVHVIHTLATGGLEKGITLLARGASPGVEHTIVCLTRSGEMARRLPQGTRVLEMHKPPGNSVRFLLKLARALKDLRPDVVHTRNWGGIDGILAARWARLHNVVHGEHGWEMADAQGRNRRRCRVRRFLQRWVKEYTCVSRHIAAWLKDDIGIRKPVTQVYNGVDTDRIRPSSGPAPLRAALGLPPDCFVVGIVGRLDPIKDHPTLFRAVAALRAGGLDARLLVAGGGPEEARLKALAGEGVVFLGNREDVPELLKAMDVFALTSFNEGISNTILEAMAAGLPVVATRVGGNPELVEDGATGVLVEPGDDARIAAALRSYADDASLKERHGAAARTKAEERFSIAAMVRAYEEVWGRVAGS